MRLICCCTLLLLFSSCWLKPKPVSPYNYNTLVWGYKPVYSSIADAKVITYSDSAWPVKIPGNIYAKGNFIYQLEMGRGIHIIDNTVPSNAHRVGFITVNGSSQISIKDNFLYTNSYNDLVVLDISASNTVSIVKRVDAAFSEAGNNYFYSEPVESGFYECPRTDSVVIDWVMDSVHNFCYKN